MGLRAADKDPEIERHIATCAECQSYRADTSAIWAGLEQLPTAEPAAGARRRFDAALSRETRLRAGPMPVPQIALPWSRYAMAAASLIIAALLGYGAASFRESAAPSTTTPIVADSTPQFLLLLYDAGASGPQASPQQIAKTIAEYSAWARGLGAAGQLVSAEKLSDAPATWFGGAVTTSAGERVGGFFLIRARNLGEARRIAETCPHLKHGGRIELRPIQPT
jgi:hypothetical protein